MPTERQTVCPFMSGPVAYTDKVIDVEKPGAIGEVILKNCLGSRCEQWITVYTTEGLQTSGCAHALAPMMVAGQLRV